MLRIIRRLGPSLGLLLTIVAWMPVVVSAQTTTWSSAPADNLWNNAANWTSGIPTNGPTADVHYGAVNSGNVNTNPVVNMNNPWEVGSITFDSGASAFNQTGNAMIIDGISGVGVVNNSTTAQTINNAIQLGADQTWNAASGNLTFGGAIDNNTHLLTIDGGSNTTINGVINGTGGLTKDGAGTLLLNSANTFGGNVTLNSGTITAGVNNAFANVDYTITGGNLNNNGKTNSIGVVTLSGAGTITVGANGVGGNLTVASLNGTDTTTSLTVGTGHFTDNTTSADTFAGALTISNGGTFELAGAAGSLTLKNTNNTNNVGGTVQIDNGATLISGATGALTTSNYIVNGTLNANGNSFNTTGLSDSGAGTRSVLLGAATMTFGDTTDAAFNGTVAGTAGSSIVTATQNTANQTLGGIVSGNTTIVANGGTLTLGNAGNTFIGNTTLNTGGTVSVGSNGALGNSANQLNFQGGTLKVTGTTFTNLDSRTINASTFNGGFNIDDPTNEFHVNQSLSGSGSLTKSGAGTLVLGGTNSYSGGTTISDGTLRGSVTGNGTGSLRGDINTTSTTATAEFNQTANGTYANVLSGSGNLLKTGNSTLILSGNNTYTGTTTISAGTLQLGGTATAAGTSGTLGTGNVIDNSTLVFNRSDDIAVANNITGTGNVIKNGGGLVTLSGTNSYSNATFVNAGRLDITGSTTTTTVNVVAPVTNSTTITGGTLGGNGTIVGDINNNGIVSPGTTASPLAILNETGTYTGNSGSTFTMNVNDDASNPPNIGTTNSALNVTGNATLKTGSKVLVNIDGNHFANNTDYTLIRVTGTADVESGVTASTNKIFVTATGPFLSNGDKDIDVTLKRSFVPVNGAATFNQIQIGNYLNNNQSNTNTDFQDVIAALTSITDDNAAREALTKLTGDIHPSMAQFNVNNTQIVVNQVASRLRAAPFAPGGPLAVADDSEPTRSGNTPVAFVGCDDSGMPEFEGGQCCGNPWAVWGIGFGMGGSTKFDGNATSANYGMGGVVAGLERWEDDSHLVGVYGAYVGSHVTAEDNQTGTMNGGQLGAYLFGDDGFNYYTVLGGLEFDGNTTVRRLNFGEGTDAISDIADGKFADWQTFIYAERGMSFESCHRVFQPFIGLQYIYLRQDSFAETGATNPALDLTGSADTVNSLRSLLGARMQWAMASHTGRRTLPEIHAIWVHEYLDTNNSITQTMTPIGGTPFITQGLDVGRDWALLGGNFTWEMLNGWSMFVNYDMQTNALTTYHVGSGGIGYRW
jgi:fibronectin-binding autotransporter adhesin